LLPEDDAGRLRELGLKVTAGRGGALKFAQPCAAFDCRCGIYEERPAYCRQFECMLLTRVQSKERSSEEARRTVARARKRVDRVIRLLRQLGDRDEHLSLHVRFRRTSRRMEAADIPPEAAQHFGALTVAVHELNLLLAAEFYPGDH